jgi:hypothetical protein
VSTYLFFYRVIYLYSKLPLVPQVPCRNQGPIRGAKDRRRGCFWSAQTNLLLGHAGDFPRGWRHTTQSAQQRNRLLLIFPSPPHWPVKQDISTVTHNRSRIRPWPPWYSQSNERTLLRVRVVLFRGYAPLSPLQCGCWGTRTGVVFLNQIPKDMINWENRQSLVF